MAGKKQSQQYDNSSIQSLKGADRVRKRPAVIFGSDGIEGCQHSVFEILSNSIDEAREGHGNKIVVTRYKDGSVSIEDFGRGIPVDYNEREGKFNWELVFCELYAGGKYQNNDGENYEFSLGLNGLGLCATQYSSEYMDAEIHRDGQKFILHFEKGENVGGLKKEPTNRRQTGSKITWRPDRNVFTDIDISLEYFQETMRRQAVVNPKVLFVLKNQVTASSFESFEYFYEEGIVDYTKELVGDQAMTGVQTFTDERRGRDREDMNDYKVKMSVAFCFSNKLNMIEYYHNSSFLEHGGSPERAVKSAFVAQIDAYLKQNNRYLKNESKISFQDVEDCLVLVSSSFSTQTSYENQTKKAITNKFIATAMTEFLRHNLEVYFIENPEEAKKIADQVLINKHSREKAERTRLDLKKTLATSNDVMARVEKFVDCRSKDKAKREIYIVEGDSALGSCKQGRDSEFQAIIPVRGKILNCLKAEYDKIFKNDIITDLIKVLGCGVEVKTKSNKDLSMFNLEALRWNKVIICTDADVDGFQIRTLILTMLYRLVPTLIEEGYVYIAESPLFEITTKEKTYFAYNEAEKSEILKRIEDQKFTIQRSKGLGENEAEMMWMTTMNPETRRLIKVMPEDVEETVRVFDLLLGDNLDGRKEFIAEHGGEYLELADIS
ncbi:MAG: DNA topoisomerase [Oscillospiraceae bacterium]|nr:DNA topoisomerase [Oscillospiraceae bacterium]